MNKKDSEVKTTAMEHEMRRAQVAAIITPGLLMPHYASFQRS